MDKILTTQQAARLKKIKAAAAKVKAEKQRRVRERIEQIKINQENSLEEA